MTTLVLALHADGAVQELPDEVSQQTVAGTAQPPSTPPQVTCPGVQKAPPAGGVHAASLSPVEPSRSDGPDPVPLPVLDPALVPVPEPVLDPALVPVPEPLPVPFPVPVPVPVPPECWSVPESPETTTGVLLEQ
jgi:hypothetical protein